MAEVVFGSAVRTDIRSAVCLILAETNSWSNFEHKLKAYFRSIGESIIIATNGNVMRADMIIDNKVYTIALIQKDEHPRPEGADFSAITRSIAGG